MIIGHYFDFRNIKKLKRPDHRKITISKEIVGKNLRLFYLRKIGHPVFQINYLDRPLAQVKLHMRVGEYERMELAFGEALLLPLFIIPMGR